MTDDLEALFSSDPLKLSDREFDQIIDHYTKMAKNWVEQEAKGEKQAKQPKIEGSPKEILAKLLGKPNGGPK